MKKGFNFNHRNRVQLVFALISVTIGWRFLAYYHYLSSAGAAGSSARPPAVEAFLPLSALVGLRAWLGTGVFDRVHPAGLVILLTAMLASFLFRKSFCSWICPFGFLEEMLGRLGVKVLPRRLQVPRRLDMILRGVKYLVLVVFLAAVFLMMSGSGASEYIASPYNKMADLKMLRFFMNLSLTTLVVFAFLFLMAFLFRRFWCRYLCPYGALMGILGWFSPTRVTRDREKCTGCGACDRACPQILKPGSQTAVVSPECNQCLDCVQACPVNRALEPKFAGRWGGRHVLPLAMLIFFSLMIAVAMLLGYWQSSVNLQDAMDLFPYIDLI